MPLEACCCSSASMSCISRCVPCTPRILHTNHNTLGHQHAHILPIPTLSQPTNPYAMPRFVPPAAKAEMKTSNAQSLWGFEGKEWRARFSDFRGEDDRLPPPGPRRRLQQLLTLRNHRPGPSQHQQYAHTSNRTTALPQSRAQHFAGVPRSTPATTLLVSKRCPDRETKSPRAPRT